MASFVILDRDGVINRDSALYVKSPDEWIPIPGSLEAIAMLSQAGIDVYVATNQSGIARGLFDLGALNAIHSKMTAAVADLGGKIKDIKFCPHHPDPNHPQGNCDCRKPKPGMLLQIASEYGLDLTGQPFVGDTRTDLEAADAAGCLPVLVKTGKGNVALRQRPTQEQVYDNLLSFARHILGV